MKPLSRLTSTLSLALVCVSVSTVSMGASDKKTDVRPMTKELSSKKIQTAPAKSTIKTLNSRGTNKTPTTNVFANGAGKADLTIIPYYQNGSLPEGHPGQSYCEKGISGGTSKNIWFFVKNIGNVAAGPSILKVFFNTFGVGGGQSSIYNQNLPSLAKNESKVIKVNLSEDCFSDNFNSSCHFRIYADTAYQVQEHNEANNYIDSKCLSPAD